METRRRTLVKSLSWRTTATFSTIAISYVITGQAELALAIGIVEFFTKILMYYLHERVWLRIKYGCEALPDYQI